MMTARDTVGKTYSYRDHRIRVTASEGRRRLDRVVIRDVDTHESATITAATLIDGISAGLLLPLRVDTMPALVCQLRQELDRTHGTDRHKEVLDDHMDHHQ